MRSAIELTGALSGHGSDLMRVIVYRRPPPVQPAAGLAEVVEPVRDRSGALRDWRLRVAHRGQPIGPSEEAAYRAWRAEFAVERFLGERAFILSFLDWADGRCDVSALQALRRHAGEMDVATALRMGWQAEQARVLLTSADDQGLGVYAPPERRSAARALIPTTPPTALLAAPGAALTAEDRGLVLHQPSAVPPEQTVNAWSVTDDGVTARTADGQTLSLDGWAARLLETLGRDAPAAQVRRVPLRRLVAPLLVFLHDAAELAGDCHTGLYIRSGPA